MKRRTVTRTLTSAEVLALGTSPVTLVLGVPDRIIWPLKALVTVGGTVAYEKAGYLWISPYAEWTADDLGLYDKGMGYLLPPGKTAELWPASADWESAADTDELAGFPLLVGVTEGDPTAGDGAITLTVLYGLAP